MIAELAAYIPRDRAGHVLRPDEPLPEEGVALIADISGFTPLTEALTRGLSADQGAEELTRALNGVFAPLIDALHAYGGSVIKFGGDALIVWFARGPRAAPAATLRRALTAAIRMQRAIAAHGTIPTPIGPVTLRMKVGLAYGPVRRFLLGLPEHGLEDVLGGRTLDRMAEAEHHAEPGEVLLDAESVPLAAGVAELAELRDGYAVVSRLLRAARPAPWPPLAWPAAEAAALAERLAAYVPRPIVETLRSGRAQVAELKPVVSLFVQFHGVDYDAPGAAAAEQLQTYFSSAQRTAARFGGRVNRLITGDKGSLLHVIFGAPRSVEEQEARAVRCALELQAAAAALPFISMQRIGVAAGRVFAGPVGAPERHDYTTMGDSINLSARLMQSAAPGQVLLEAGVRERLGPEFALDDLGGIRVKGKADPIAVFAVRAAGLAREARRRDPRPAPPLVGREAELAELRRALAAGGGVLAVTGEVGIGKTLLIDALRAEAADAQSPPRWADGICLAYGETLPGFLFVDLLRDLLELPAESSPEAQATALRERCAALFGPSRVGATAPYLARFLGLPLDQEAAARLAGLSGESLRWALFELVPELIRRAAERRPLVLALDDLQWADPTSLELLGALAPLVGQAPVTLLLAMRPEEQSRAWALSRQLAAAAGGRAAVVQLGPITPEAARALLAQLAPGLAPQLAAHLAERAGGNPLFLTELARTLLASGLPEGDVAPESLGLPDTVQGLLLAQIDRLAVEARHTLQLAAVIGRRFLQRVLDALAAGEQALDARLAELVRRAFVQPDLRDGHEPAFLFRHALIQESAYATLLYERRRAYHRLVAETIERLFPGDVVEQAGALAHHYERADDPAAAIGYQLQAGDSARLLGANEEARQRYQRALALLESRLPEDDGRRSRIFLRLAAAHAAEGDHAGAQEWYERSFAQLDGGDAAGAAPEGSSISVGIFAGGPSTLDPGTLATIADEEIAPDLFEGLVELDAELSVRPALARRWSVDQEGRRYRFELRPGLRWSDGAPLTAHDVVFAWRRNLGPESGSGVADLLHVVAGARAYSAGEVADPATIGVRALDDRTLEVELEAPSSSLIYLLADPVSFPQPEHAFRVHGERCFAPELLVCSGPFTVAEWRQGEQIVLARNPHYYRALPSGPERVVLQFVPPSYEQYLAGAIDICRVEDRSDVLRQHPAESFVRQFLATYFLAFDCAHAPFSDQEARRAAALALDREELVRSAWAGVQLPASGGIVPPGMPGHTPELSLRPDPELARVLLAARAPLPPITLAALPGSGSAPRFIAESWRAELGLDVRLAEDVPYHQIVEGLRDGAYQVALIGCDAAYPDPHAILADFTSGGLFDFGWHSPAFDELVRGAISLPEPRARLARYHRADRALVAETCAAVPLYYYRAFGLIRPGLRIAGVERVVRGGALRLKHIQVTAG